MSLTLNPARSSVLRNTATALVIDEDQGLVSVSSKSTNVLPATALDNWKTSSVTMKSVIRSVLVAASAASNTKVS
ncbi:MAG: hypothetical protein AAGK77_00240 [Pseudomonadota bacterium]